MSATIDRHRLANRVAQSKIDEDAIDILGKSNYSAGVDVLGVSAGDMVPWTKMVGGLMSGIGGALGGGGGGGGGGSSDMMKMMAMQQMQAQQQQQQQQMEQMRREQAAKESSKKIWTIAGIGVGSVALLGGLYFMLRK